MHILQLENLMVIPTCLLAHDNWRCSIHKDAQGFFKLFIVTF